jgi:hypothetical protein
MEKPILSKNFSVDDIHKLREYHFFVRNKSKNPDADFDKATKWLKQKISLL